MLLNILRGIKPVAVILVSLLFLALYSSGDDDKKKTSKPAGINIEDSYRLEINRIKLPLNNRGVLANTSVAGGLQGGFFDGIGFLFSGGFMLSGKNGDTIWSNGVASASRIEDYLPGEVGGTDDQIAHLYVVNSEDEPFGESWQEWKDAVDLGAYFYDGDGDGIYNPVDKNGDGIWNPDEDMPDLLGDETVWCVYNDALPQELRLFSEQYPVGIEIRQTVWAYADSDNLGNVVFIRYSINNAGTVSEVFDSVYFGAYADADLGYYEDDLVGCDTILNAGYAYNNGSDRDYGVNPPCFIIDYFQGPWFETGNPDDIALNVKGTVLGTDTIYGAVNVPMTSFNRLHIPSLQGPYNKIQARNYLLGKNEAGEIINPCTWVFGEVLGGVDCSTIDGKFMYSGDPVAEFGWIDKGAHDPRQMSNTGPFTLEKDKPVDIVVAYVVGRSSSAEHSIVVAKQIDRAGQFLFDNNFNFPPTLQAVTPAIKTTDNGIELVWETSDHLNYREAGRNLDMMFESFEVYMHETNSLAEEIDGRQNTILVASYDVANGINNIFLEDPLSYNRALIYTQGIQLDSSTYSDLQKGRISLTITTDPFTNTSLIKGKPYFISIVPTAYNRPELIKLDVLGNYLIPGTAVIGRLAGSSKILSDGVSPFGIVPGKDSYTPFKGGVLAEHYQGGSDAVVTYDVKDKSKVTNHEYEVNFIFDSASTLYELYYMVTDLDNGTIEIDSSKQYGIGLINDIVGGAVVNVEWVEPGIRSTANYYAGTGSPWFDNDTITNKVGTWYMGGDVVDPLGFPVAINESEKSGLTRASDMKSVELRFGQSGKAYRYLKRFTYKYAGDSGFVDVPFQAWAVDKNSGTEYQLAVGFTESALASDTLANPDGIYDPGTDVFDSKEYIIVFNSRYDPEGNAYAYTGNSASWANLGGGYNLNSNDPRFNDSLKAVAKSSYFDALYVAGIQRAVGQDTAEMTGIYSIEVFSLLKPEDKYRFKVNIDITVDAERELFNKINVFPNPLFSNNPVTAYTGESGQHVTFSYLPEEVTIKIYSLAGNLIRTLDKNDESPYKKWDLKNEHGRRVGSGMYLAIVSNTRLGEKVLKFAIIQPKN